VSASTASCFGDQPSRGPLPVGRVGQSPSMVSMPHSLLLRDLSILPTPVRWRSEYVHIVAQSRGMSHEVWGCHAHPATPSELSYWGPSHHALASPRAFCYAFRTRSYRVLSHNRDLLHLIRGPMLGLLSVPHPERRSIRASCNHVYAC